ncbi:MAG: murein hydrolase activator EnvC family protein, partial [bacterium]
LEELRKERGGILKQRQTLRKNARRSLSQLEETRSRRKAALNDLRDRKEFYEQRMKELENQQQKLKEVVLELQKEKESTEARLERITHRFGSKKGELPWPVESRNVFRPFGTWEEDGITIKNDGIDIKVEEGSPVNSVAPGEVAFARPYRGMGKVVIIQHGDEYTTLYGSLVELAVQRGDEIKEGAIIGRAGQTAGLDEPRLYFQIFHGRDILNPEDWLN